MRFSGGAKFPRESTRPRNFSRLFLIAMIGLLFAAAVARTAWRRLHRAPAVAQQRAFYFWKTRFTNSPAIEKTLVENRISRLYVRFFDVDWEELAHVPLPVSPLQLDTPLPRNVEIVPVVFITNRTFLSTAPSAVEPLADHVLQKVLAMADQSGLSIFEVQLDCDWSDGTRARYFHFLSRLRTQLHTRKLRLSSTIRLHQIKYAERTGVPPVDRGMLMFYNFGPLRADAARSSIFNLEDAQRYASYIASYALPLDLVLPIFAWAVHARDGAVMGLLEKLEPRDIEDTGAFVALSPGHYKATRSLFLHGRYVMEDDELRLEKTTPQMTQQAATLAARGAGEKHYSTVAFFDLDERNLQHYVKDDLEQCFTALY